MVYRLLHSKNAVLVSPACEQTQQKNMRDGPDAAVSLEDTSVGGSCWLQISQGSSFSHNLTVQGGYRDILLLRFFKLSGVRTVSNTENKKSVVWFCSACETFDAVLQLLSNARQHLNEILSAFEFLDNDSLRASCRHVRLSSPVKTAPFYVLIETSGSNSEHDELKLQSFVDIAMSSELVKDGVIASEPSKIKVFFH